MIFVLLLCTIAYTYECDSQVAATEFKKKVLTNPIPAYTDNPYERNDPEYLNQVEQALYNKQIVCAIKFDESKIGYELQTFDTAESAESDGFIVTHQGRCSACSTLQDLAVYLTTDLTRPVRRCGLKHFASKTKLSECIRNLGFTDTCTQIWVFNTLFTKQKCLKPCLISFLRNEPFVKPDGNLNNCLECDEDNAGPIFKYESGRTRRNSGIHSEIDRPEDSIYPISQCYY